MRILHLLTILCLSCTVYANNCKHPLPKQNFSPKDFTGKWIGLGIDALGKSEMKKFQNASCSDNYYNLENGVDAINTWVVDMMLGESLKSDLGGTYHLPDPSKGLLKLYYKAQNFTYDFTVMCTDYKTWSAIYGCSEDPGIDSAFVLLFVRDIAKYDEVISKPEVQNCYKDVMDKSVSQITRRQHDHCLSENN